MDISKSTKEQKAAAAVTWLSQNAEKAPEAAKKSLSRLIALNNEGMQLVQRMNQLQNEQAKIDAEIGQKIGGAKELFIVIGDILSDEQIDEFATKFDPATVQQQQKPQGGPDVSIAGGTASKSQIIMPGAQ